MGDSPTGKGLARVLRSLDSTLGSSASQTNCGEGPAVENSNPPWMRLTLPFCTSRGQGTGVGRPHLE